MSAECILTEFRSNKIKAGKQIGMNKKQQFLNVTYEILNEEGVAGVSIRRLAKEVGCTSTVIYRYFDNVEHLIIMASVRYLERYIADFKRYTKEIRNPLELNLTLWERFVTYALEKVDVFEMLFSESTRKALLILYMSIMSCFRKNSRIWTAYWSASFLTEIFVSGITSCIEEPQVWDI